jgi:hypothetical protein
MDTFKLLKIFPALPLHKKKKKKKKMAPYMCKWITATLPGY